jgi:hypothetical protein
VKGKSRRLRTYDVKNLNYFNNMIVAACCLHNFTLDLLEPGNEGDQPDDFNEENDLDEDQMKTSLTMKNWMRGP